MTIPSTAPGSQAAQRKAQVRGILLQRDFQALTVWACEDRNPMRTLSMLLFDSDELVRWRAAEAFGRVAALEADRDLDRVRRQISRLLWLMNDESGGLCWNAPETIGEIVYNVPRLIEDYGQLLPSFFVEEPFEAGSRWAVARVGRLKPSIFGDVVNDLVRSLKDADPTIRGYSLLALAATDPATARTQAMTVDGDNGELTVYDYQSGDLLTTSVRAIAAQMTS